MKTIINENQRGLLFKNGRFVKPLAAGKYSCFGGSVIETVELGGALYSENASLEALLASPAVKAQTVSIEVPDCSLALHFVDGKFREALTCGKYAFWSAMEKHEFRTVSITSPEIENVPEYIIAKLPQSLYIKVEVEEYCKARLYFNRRFVRLLDAGTYYFWNTQVSVSAESVDTRLTQAVISGQEMLTQDKVAVRVNFVWSYRITDCVKVGTEVNNFRDQLYTVAQLALREYVGSYRIDELLENKEQLSSRVLANMKEHEKELYVEIGDAGVRDIILPGEFREIMNTVLVAEKRAQANVITRREEVASTRSLLNTAKLMDENKTLYKLKELEYIERICERVDSISVGGNGDLLSQLSTIVGARGKEGA